MGYREDQREQALKDVPLYVSDSENWPSGVRSVGIDELDNLGIDRNGVLYWNGRVITVEKRLTLSFWQKAWAVLVTGMALLVSISTIFQGLAAYSPWACTIGLPSICP